MADGSTEEFAHLEQLAALLQRRRRVLEIQRTRFGDPAPAAIVLELEDTEQQLAQIQAELRQLRPRPADVDSPYLGLLTFHEDDSTFFFGRDALIGAWPTRGDWITTARGDLRLQIQLGEAAKDWVASGENPDLPWSDLRLDTVEAWLERARPRLNIRDQRFLDASRVHRQAELEAKEAIRQRELKQARALAAGAIRLRRLAMYL